MTRAESARRVLVAMMISTGSLRLEPGWKLSLPLGSLFGYLISSMAAIPDIGKKRGRPAVGSTGVMVKLPPNQLALLDRWARDNGELSRPEAVRRLIARGMGQTSKVMRGS